MSITKTCLFEAIAVFDALESISIDYGIMEKVRELAVIPADVGWSDLGSWHTIWELGNKDAAGNVAHDAAVLVDAQNNLIENLRTVPSGKRVIALEGGILARDERRGGYE